MTTSRRFRPTPQPKGLSARADLRRICGRPRAWGPTAVCALEDAYHGLLIGPCDEAISGQEEDGCRLVFKMFVTIDEGLDCTYAEWVRHFRGAVHEASARDKKSEVTEPYEFAEAEQAAQAGTPISLDEGRFIERQDEGWVVVEPPASCLFEVERFVWSNDEALVFKSPATARTAYQRAREYEEGRKTRYREAMAGLGRPLHGRSRYEEETSLGN